MSTTLKIDTAATTEAKEYSAWIVFRKQPDGSLLFAGYSDNKDLFVNAADDGLILMELTSFEKIPMIHMAFTQPDTVAWNVTQVLQGGQESQDLNLIISVRKSVASNPSTSASILETLSKDKDSDVRNAVARNSSTPANIFEILSKDEDFWVRRAVALNPSTPKHILETLAKDVHSSVRRVVANHPSTPASILETLSKDCEPWVRENVALNPSTPASILETFSKDEYWYVRSAAAKSLNFCRK
jgi:hypothetical protein